MTTEAERQAARYEEDPDGVLRWFMDHPEESKDWENLFMADVEMRGQRRHARFKILIAIGLIVWTLIITYSILNSFLRAIR